MPTSPDHELVAIILVNWNGTDDTLACIESCRALTYPNFKTVVVDNASSDDSVERLRDCCPYIELIVAETNLGFAGGNNLGIRWALEHDASYVWLLNNDTVVEGTTLSALVEAIDAEPSTGIAGSKIYYYDRPETLWFAGGFILPGSGRTSHRGEGELDRGQYETPDEVDYATGASMLVRKEVVEQVGPMSEDYFLYWEETDWCERARQAGWRIIYAPGSRVWHKVGASTPDDLAHQKWRYEGRNRVMFFKRNRPNDVAPVVAMAVGNSLYLLVRGRPKSAWAMLQGIIDATVRMRVGRIGG